MVIELTAAQAEIITQMNAGPYHPCAPDRETNKQIQTDVYVGWSIITKVRQGVYIL